MTTSTINIAEIAGIWYLSSISLIFITIHCTIKSEQDSMKLWSSSNLTILAVQRHIFDKVANPIKVRKRLSYSEIKGDRFTMGWDPDDFTNSQPLSLDTSA